MSYNRGMKRFVRDEEGQTVVEYILMIAVVFSIGVLFLKKVDALLISNPNSLFGKQISGLKSQLQTSAGNRYKYLPFRVK